jgi:hypothetical protein
MMVELTRRYAVMTMATEAPFDLRDPEGVFVLKPWKDPAALRALRAYAECCYPELARDLGDWIRAIEREPGTRGDIGRRNEAHIARTAAPRKKAARASKPRRAAKKAARGTKKRRRS